MAASVILVEASPRDPATGAATIVRLAGGGGVVAYRYGGQHWRAGISALPKSVASLNFDGEQLGGGGVAQAMELRWSPGDPSRLAMVAALFWNDAPVTVRIGPEGNALPPVITSGLVLEAAAEDGTLRIALADQAVDLKRALLVDRFAGTGGIEGPAEWKDLIKTRAWGRCFNVPGRIIHKAANIVCFGDPMRPWDAFLAIRDRGVPASAEALTVLAWQGSAEATFAALIATAATEGGGVLCPSIACVKWWTEPAGDLHADIRGETAGGYVETAAEIAARIVAARSTLTFSAGTIAAAVAARPGPFGWRVDSEGSTAAEEISELLAGVSLSWPIINDAIVLRPWTWSAPTRSAKSQRVSRRQSFKPVIARRIGYRRNWSPMARGDLAAAVLAGDVTYADGTPVEDLKPAQAGATKGAPVGTDVAGKAAEDVAAAIDTIDGLHDSVDDLIATYGETEAAYTARLAAEAAAEAASGFADVSGDNAQAAATYSGMSTRGSSITQNPNFTNWPEGQALPTGWGGWFVETYPYVLSRTTGVDGYPNAVRMVLLANQNGGIVQVVSRPFGAYVIELTIRADNVAGAGVFVQLLNADYSQFGDGSANLFLSLLNKKDTSGWPGGSAGASDNYLRTFSWYFATPIDGNIAHINFYAMGNWENLSGPRNAKTLDVHAFRARPAYEAEIAQKDPITGLDAKASHDEVVTVAVDKAGTALTTARDEYNARFNLMVPTGVSNAIAQRPTYTEVDASVSTSITAAAGPGGIVAQKIDEVSVSTGGNIVPNAGLVSLAGWVLANDGGVAVDSGLNLAGDDWRPFNENVLSIHQVGGNNGQEHHWYTDPIPVEYLKFYQGLALAGPHRCDCSIHIEHLNDSYAEVAPREFSTRQSPGGAAYGGRRLDQYLPCWLNFQAKGTYIRLAIDKFGTNAHEGFTDSWLFALHPQIARVSSLNASRLVYQPSGDQAVSRVTQGAINTLDGRTSGAYFRVAVASPGGESVLDLASDSIGGTVFRVRAGTIVLEGNVLVSNSVGTSALADFSVNNIVASAGPFTELTTGNTTLFQLTITTTGKPVLIQVGGQVAGSEEIYGTLVLERLGYGQVGGALGFVNQSVAQVFKEDLAAGTYTYRLSGTVSANDGSGIVYPALILQEVKK